MPKGGKKGGHKGRARMYTSPEEIDAQMKAEKERKQQEQEEDDGAAQNDLAEDKLPESGSEDSDDDASEWSDIAKNQEQVKSAISDHSKRENKKMDWDNTRL